MFIKLKLKMKKIFLLILIALFSMSSFASIVSDNDGSNFVTKGEFDSLKNSFNSQIDAYNDSIDKKIDGAIAQYLAGLVTATKRSKTILIGDQYKTVGYYDDATNIKYSYGHTGMSYMAYGTVHAGSNTSLIKNEERSTRVTTLKASRPAVAGKECCVNYDSTSKIKYIWAGFYGNVKWSVSTNAIFSSSLNGAYWSSARAYTIKGPIFGYNLNAMDNAWETVKNIAWFEVYWHSDVNNDGVYANTQYFTHTYVNSINNVISVEYGDVADAKYINGKLDQYVIAYRHEPNVNVNMCTGYNNCRKSIIPGAPATSRIYTSTVQNWWNGATIDEGKFISTWMAANNTNIDNGSATLSKRTDLKSTPAFNTWWNTTQYMPVFGGVGELTGKNIRQEQNNLFDSDVGPSIQLEDISLSAGLPVCIEKKDTKVEWPIKFSDTTKTYKVWLSYEPFDTKADTACDYGNPARADKYVTITNNTATTDYMTINGSGILKWTMEDTGPVYCKWCVVDGGTDKCGGQLDLKNSSTYMQFSTE